MTSLEIFNLVVYIVLALVIFSFFFLAVKVWFNSESELIGVGKYDDEIRKNKKKKEHKIWKYVRNVLSAVLLGGVLGLAITLFVTTTVKESINVIGTAPISILSGSMSEKNHLNEYLFKNDLNDQFNEGDLILLDKLPEQDDLELYDVVGYFNSDGELVVHRIIGGGYYDEQNVFHYVDNLDDAENYIMRGDANNNSDSTYITYNDMYGIYDGYKIPYCGFVTQYLQSGFGIVSLCGIAGIIFSYDYYVDKYNKKYNARKDEVNEEELNVDAETTSELSVEEKNVELLNEPDYLQIGEPTEEVSDELEEEQEDTFSDLEKDLADEVDINGKVTEDIPQDVNSNNEINIDDLKEEEGLKNDSSLNETDKELEQADVSDINIEELNINESTSKFEKDEEEVEKKEKINKDDYLYGERNEKDVRSTVKRLNK